MTTQHTHIQHDQPIEAITFQPEGWCQVLHRFIREHMRRLPGGPVKIMLHMFDERDRRSGRTLTDRKRIASNTGLSPASISEGIRLLETFQPILLAVHSPTEFEVYPGTVFAGAYARNETMLVRPREIALRCAERSVRPTERDFAPPNGRSAPSMESRACGSKQEGEEETNNNSHAVVVEILLSAGIGFERHEAEAIAALPDVDANKVRNAIEGARNVRKAGKLKVTPAFDANRCMRGWVSKAVRERWNLFDQAAADQYAQERKAAAMPGQVEELKARTQGLWRTNELRDELTETLQTLGGWEGALAVLPPWKYMSAERIREILLGCAEQKRIRVGMSRSNA
jgi:hypothetical protein